MLELDKAICTLGDMLNKHTDPRDDIREESTAQLNEELLTIDIDTGTPGYIYDVDLERCNTPGEMLDWIFQVKQKTWCTPDIIFDLLTVLDVACEIYHGASVQGCLCPWGISKKVTWKRLKS